MITADVTKLIEQLKQYHLDAVKRMENMVAHVAYEFVLALGNETPVGDIDGLENNRKYRKFYTDRYKQYGIPVEVGYHQGSWQFSTNGNLQFSTMIAELQGSADDAYNEAQASYKLGQTFYIGANTPAMVILEDRQSQMGGDGIVKPAIDKVMALYRIKASDYYNK